MTIILGPPLSGKTTRLIEACLAALTEGTRPEQILCLTFFPANAEAIRQKLRTQVVSALPHILPLQSFQRQLLHTYAAPANLSVESEEISAPVRLVLLLQAWAQVNGLLWQAHGTAPGAVIQMANVIDWLSQNRTRFDVADGELGRHEIAQTYRAFIELFIQQGLLTFQESSLRCLQLLEDETVLAEVHKRYPVVLVDDLHLARPDQLALVNRLRGSETHFTATAWLSDAGHSAPELTHIQQTIAAWGETVAIEPLPLEAVNPAIVTAIDRLVGRASSSPENVTQPITLTTSFTVEDELQGVATRIVRALLADPTLKPADILVAAADSSLVPFAVRVLSQYGLPIVDAAFTVRHTPLVQGGLLVIQWLTRPTIEIEEALLSLPYTWVDPLDRSTLRLAAVRLNKSIFALTAGDLTVPLSAKDSFEQFDRVRQCLFGLAGKPITAQIIQSTVSELGGLAWVEANTEPTHAIWLKAFNNWLNRVRELEAIIDIASVSSAERASLIDNLSDYPVAWEQTNSIQLITSSETNGHTARLAFVIGLSENATPVLKPEFQLLSDTDLSALFADRREVVLPKAREQTAWLEREARSLALLLSRGHEQLHISVSRYTSRGDSQLPSPFFERLLGADGEIDRDGNFTIHTSGLWQLTHPDPAAIERLLPLLDVEPPTQQPALATLALSEHTFSASQLKMYLTCPLQFFYGRVLGIESEGAGYFDRGSLLHEVLCATLGDGSLGAVDLRDRPRPLWMNSRQRLLDRAMAALKAAWAGTAVTLPGGGDYQPTIPWHERFGPRLQREAVRRWAEGVVEDWAAYEVDGLPNSEARRPVFLEASFTLDMGSYRLIGRIDRIDEIQTENGLVYELIDYKTGKAATGALTQQIQKFLPLEGKQASDYQLPLYALALMNGIKELKATPETLRFINLESLQLKLKGGYIAEASRAIQVTPSGVVDAKTGVVPITTLTGEIKDGIMTTMQAMSSAPYPAQPDMHCGYCSFRTACDRGQGQAEAA